jgi:hypothetical protein
MTLVYRAPLRVDLMCSQTHEIEISAPIIEITDAPRGSGSYDGPLAAFVN